MTDNKIITGGGIQPSTIDTPADVRTRVETFADIANIDNPFRGMEVYVVDEDKEYRIVSLTSKIIGGMEIPNAAIDISDPQAIVDIKAEIAEEASRQIAQKSEYDEESGTLTLL